MGQLGSFKEFLVAHAPAVYVGMFVMAALVNSWLPLRNKVMVVILWSVVLAGVVVFTALAFAADRIASFTIQDVAYVLLGYAVALYAALCDLFRFGFARYLTDKRGYKWVKELDYPYLILGFIGLFVSLEKLSVLKGHTTKYDVLGPILVATAIVIRFVKTRAEIENWATRA